MSLTVVGGIALDLIDQPPRPMHGPVLGGSASYAALAAAPLAEVRVVSAVGTDLSTAALDYFRDARVDVSEVAILKGRTAVWQGRYTGTADGRRSDMFEQGVAAGYFPEVSRSARASRGLLLGAGNPAVQLAVRRQFPAETLVGIDTIDHWISDDGPGVRAALSTANVIFIGRSEARQLTERQEPHAIAAALGLRSDQALVLKGGKLGSWLLCGEQFEYVPAFEVSKVVDPTGAGDAYAGAFMAFASQAGQPTGIDRFARAMLYGTAAGSILVEGYGVTPLLGLDAGQVERRVAALSSRDQVPPG